MITLITGTPGSGKSLRAVYLISKALEEGRPVFTDIDGIALDGVTTIDQDHDWRDTPEGSLVVYDEVQRRWPSTGRPGHAPDEDIRALETHRHTGHDIIVITQHPTLVHHHVRKLVGEHVHVRRTSGAKAVSLFTSSEVFDPKDSRELRNTDKQLWRYPKHLFEKYKSATAHTHKFKIPAKIKLLLLAIIGIFATVLYFLFTIDLPWSDSDSDTSNNATPRAESEARPAALRPLALPDSGAVPLVPKQRPQLFRALHVETIPTISGCLSTASDCRCWDGQGKPMNTSPEQCALILSDMPRALVMGGGGSSRRGSTAISEDGLVDANDDYQTWQNPETTWWREPANVYSP